MMHPGNVMGGRSPLRWSPAFLEPVRLAGNRIKPVRNLGIGVIEAFPNIQNIQAANPSGGSGDAVGFKLASVTQGIGFSVGGVALTYVSRFLPGVAETATLVGGIGLLGFGVYKFVNVLSGNAEPSVQTFHAAPDLPKDAISVVSGKILAPNNGGAAELSNMWAALFDTQRTFKIKFVVSNEDTSKDGKAIPLLVEFNTEQVSRPWIGDPDISNFSTTYVIDDLAPGDSKVINANQPIQALGSVLQPQSYRSQDLTATLTARTSAGGNKKVLHKISFTAW